MKDLRDWLHWALHETGVPADGRANRAPELDAVAFTVIGDAAYQVRERGDGADEAAYSTTADDIAWCLTHHPEAFGELVRAFADAVERMRAAVPEGQAEPFVEQTITTDVMTPEPGRPWYLTEVEWQNEKARAVVTPEDCCPACRRKPCDGTHMRCTIERFAADRGRSAAEVTLTAHGEHLRDTWAAIRRVNEQMLAAERERPTGIVYFDPCAWASWELKYEYEQGPRSERAATRAAAATPAAHVATPLRQARRNPI